MSARTLSILLLSLALVAPMARDATAGGKGVKAPVARKAKKAKRKQKRKVRAKVRARKARKAIGKMRDRGSRLRAKLFSRKAKNKDNKAAKKKKTNFLTKRRAVKDRQKSTKSSLKQGRLNAAAKEATGSMSRDSKGRFIKGGIRGKLSMRERFAMWRNARKVRKSATRMARKRSKSGDVEGTKDALKALGTLEKGGRLGVIGRWKKARAEKRAFKNSFRAARKALKQGDAQGASELQQFASGLRGGTRAERRQLRKLSKAAVKLARGYAKTGNPEATWQALNMSAELTAMAGKKPRTKRFDRIMNRAFKTGATILVKEAKAAYKARKFDEAAIKVAEANNIQGSVKGLKLSRRTRRTARRLTRNLGPRLDKVQAQAAKAAAQETSVTQNGDTNLSAINQAGNPKRASRGRTSEQVIMSNGAR